MSPPVESLNALRAVAILVEAFREFAQWQIPEQSCQVGSFPTTPIICKSPLVTLQEGKQSTETICLANLCKAGFTTQVNREHPHQSITHVCAHAPQLLLQHRPVEAANINNPLARYKLPLATQVRVVPAVLSSLLNSGASPHEGHVL
eukprot:5107365-Amphidinium_carterae.2